MLRTTSSIAIRSALWIMLFVNATFTELQNSTVIVRDVRSSRVLNIQIDKQLMTVNGYYYTVSYGHTYGTLTLQTVTYSITVRVEWIMNLITISDYIILIMIHCNRFSTKSSVLIAFKHCCRLLSQHISTIAGCPINRLIWSERVLKFQFGRQPWNSLKVFFELSSLFVTLKRLQIWSDKELMKSRFACQLFKAY